MELWIRSQNRKLLTKVNNGIIYYEDDNKRNCIANIESEKGISILGAYQTKERALEELDEIQCHLVNINDSRDSYFYVYEMPKE